VLGFSAQSTSYFLNFREIRKNNEKFDSIAAIPNQWLIRYSTPSFAIIQINANPSSIPPINNAFISFVRNKNEIAITNNTTASVITNENPHTVNPYNITEKALIAWSFNRFEIKALIPKKIGAPRLAKIPIENKCLS
jgi:hypothetical protein